MIIDDWACSPVGDRQILTGSDLSGTFKRPGGYTLRITRNGAESGAVSRTPEYATITRAWTGRLMTVRAYQLVDTAPGSDVSALIDALRAIDGTKTVDAVTGPHDIICTVQVDELANLAGYQTEVHNVPGVTRTMTCVVLHG